MLLVAWFLIPDSILFTTFAIQNFGSMTVYLLVYILSALAFQVFPVSLGTNIKQNTSKAIAIITSLIITQALMFWLGIFIGKRFLHLTVGFESVVVFIGFFLIGMRVFIESFAVRKGERTFNSDNNQSMILASMAQSINTFLAGMMFYFFSFEESLLLGILLISTLIISLIGSFIIYSKQSLAFSSLIYLLGGLGLIISAIYLGFFTEL